MAFAAVQYKNTLSNATSSASVTLTATGAGNVMIVCAVTNSRTGSSLSGLSGVSGTVTQLTGVQMGTSTSDGSWMDVWIVVNINSTSSITVSNSASKVVEDVHVFEYSGFGTASITDGIVQPIEVTTPAPTIGSGASLGASGDFVFTCVFAITTAGAAGASVTKIADTAATSFQGTNGVDQNVAGYCRFASSWATLTAALSSDTITFTKTGSTVNGLTVFALKSASPSSIIYTRRQRGWGY